MWVAYARNMGLRRILLATVATALAALLPAAPAGASTHYFRLSVEGTQTPSGSPAMSSARRAGPNLR